MLSSKMMVIIEKLNSEDERTALTPASPWSLSDSGIGDLVLDLLRAAAHPVGEDDDLVLAQVGDGVHRRVAARRRRPRPSAPPPRSGPGSDCGSNTRSVFRS